MEEKILKIKQKRFLFLKELYERVDGDSSTSININTLGNILGFNRTETARIFIYLKEEGLAEPKAMGGAIGITHQGVIEVEKAFSNPDESTTYFPPVNIIQVEKMVNSQIQQNTSKSTQTVSFSTNDLEKIKNFISELSDGLPDLNLSDDSNKEIDADIKSVESQLNSPSPKPSIIKECFASIRTILEGAAGNAVAVYLLSQLQNLS
jgi:hypothetical protein